MQPRRFELGVLPLIPEVMSHHTGRTAKDVSQTKCKDVR